MKVPGHDLGRGLLHAWPQYAARITSQHLTRG